MNAITRNDIVRRDDSHASGLIDHSVVIMNMSLNEYYDLNRQASDIWTRLATPQRVAELCETLCLQYQVDVERCELEVLALLNRFNDKGIISVCDKSTA